MSEIGINEGLGYGWIWVDKVWLTQLRWVLGWGMLGRVC